VDNRELSQRVCALTGASAAHRAKRIQSLWSGYGEVVRMRLDGHAEQSVVVKVVRPPGGGRDRSHRRKLRSYNVEMAWYRDFSARCTAACRVPAVLGLEAVGGGWLFVLEDLDAAGFSGRRHAMSEQEIVRCLQWLGSFHGTFMGCAPDQLWAVGTYWHLATRPDELTAISDRRLRDAARPIDTRLSGCRYKSLVHGDAKVTNFCFGRAGVSAVDFQYVGGGCGMKDVAYFLSCLSSRQCEASADRYLDVYFVALRQALSSEMDAAAVEAEWRELYPWAWADFDRFLAGWAPGYYDTNTYSRRMTQSVLSAL